MPDVPILDHATEDPPKRGLGTVFLIVVIDLLGFGLIIPLLPFYALKHDASALQVTLLFSAYSACQFIASPILGMISDRIGRRPVLIISQIGSAGGFILLGFVTQHQWANASLGLIMLYVSRIIDGLSGGNISTAQAYISDVTTHENRAKGMGLIGAAFGIGFVAGPAIGGVLGHYNPAWPAYLAAALATTAAVLTWTRLPESRRRRPAEAEAWLHPRQFLPVLRRPALGQLMLVWFVCMAAFVMADSSIAMYLADTPGFHYGPREVGWYFTLVGVIIAIIQGGLIGRLTRRFGEWPLAILGPVLVAFGMSATCFTAFYAHILVLVLAGFALATGRSFQQPTISALVSKYSSDKEQGVAFGLFQGLGSLARVIGPIVAGLVYPVARHTGPFMTASMLLLIATVWSAVIQKKHPVPQ